MATKRKAYTVSTKLQAVAVAERSSKEAAARHFSVDPRRIREWCAQKDALEKMNKQRGAKRSWHRGELGTVPPLSRDPANDVDTTIEKEPRNE